ncbi:flagellar hook-associated protein 2 [Modicisalibacter xianhensis]|uniref:Flagellar hook-associated protein 2 n=1 Tax=Modicisalibacter xianhensis TaxID=442341 RepID=A0A4R8G3F2_9GAMM|nr:flagellar filament capping protein FliD [Halomonas xianhensis]TDX31003.1 flagellar hook-associated protein 2 [Halomonas xianhensis]
MASISSLGIGSGMDLNGLLDQLKSAERQKLTPIVAQKSNYNAKISAFGKLESALDKFQQAAAKLNEAESFRAVKSNVTGDAFTAAADSTAVAGTYKISVNQLAQAHSMASSGVEDRTSDRYTGTLKVTVGSEAPLEIDLTGGGSLETIRDAINAEEGKLTASIINDGTNDRLVLTAKETGLNSQITVESSTDANTDLATLTGSMATTVDAKDASFKVNNIDITSSSNRVEGAIQGVTLNLAKETGIDSPETLTVSQDGEAIAGNIKSFVDAYNSLKSTMDNLTSFNAETGAAGQLLGDNTMRSVESRLRNVMTGSLGEGSLQMLSDIGIELQLDGKLEVDSEKLDELVANNPESLSRFFGGDNAVEGFSDKLEATLKTILDEKGLLDNATSGLKDRISSLDDRYERVESSINSTIERYRKQFADMDMLVSQMNSTMTYLSQQFEAMNAQLGRD